MRLGVLGGTFDPPHLGHLIVAQDVWQSLSLDRLLFVPSASPPHKRGQVRTPAELRLAMMRAATAGDPRFEVSDLELRRHGPSYSVDTLRELRTLHPGAALFFVIGSDQLRELHTWREPEEIARLATLVVVSRGGDAGEAGGVALPYRPVEVTRIDISATEIRRRAAAGQPIRYLVPAAVEAIVRRERLYGAPAADRSHGGGVDR